MPVETLVGLADERAVEPSCVAARLVARDEKGGITLRVEGEGVLPLTVRESESHQFQVCMPQAVQHARAWPSQLRPELPQETSQGEYRPFVKPLTLCNLDLPDHRDAIILPEYEVKDLSVSSLRSGCQRCGKDNRRHGVTGLRSLMVNSFIALPVLERHKTVNGLDTPWRKNS